MPKNELRAQDAAQQTQRAPKEVKSGRSATGWVADRFVSAKRTLKEKGLLGSAKKKEALEKKKKRAEELDEIMRAKVGPSGVLAVEDDPERKRKLGDEAVNSEEDDSWVTKGVDAAFGVKAGRFKDTASFIEGSIDASKAAKAMSVASRASEVADAAPSFGVAHGLSGYSAIKSGKELYTSIKDAASDDAAHDRMFMSKGRRVQEVANIVNKGTSTAAWAAGAIPGAEPAADVLTVIDAGAGMLNSGLEFGNSMTDRRRIKKAKDEVQSTRQKNMLNFGQSRAEHDARGAAADFTKNAVIGATTIGAMAATSGVGGKIGLAAGRGLNLGIDAITYGVQKHYDKKAERHQIDQETEATNEERAAQGLTPIKNYAGMKAGAYEGVNELRAQQAADGGKATRYTKTEIKDALSRQVAGTEGGREGINKAILAKYVRELSDPGKIEQNRTVLNALGFDLKKAEKKAAEKNVKRAKKGKELISATPLPTEGAIAKALGWRGKDKELQQLLAGTQEGVPKEKASAQQASTNADALIDIVEVEPQE